jgi:hypothetical protein
MPLVFRKLVTRSNNVNMQYLKLVYYKLIMKQQPQPIKLIYLTPIPLQMCKKNKVKNKHLLTQHKVIMNFS